MISTHNIMAIGCMKARHAQKAAFSCAGKQNILLKPPFLGYVSPLNKPEASSLMDLELALLEVEQ